MAKYTPEFKEEIKNAYLAGNESLAAIANRFGVGERTVEGWSKNGGWDALKRAQKVVSIGEAKKKPLQPTPESPHINPPSIRQRRRGETVDELGIVDEAIESLSYLVTSIGAGGEVDTRGIGSTAGALVRLLEYKRKICPPTAAALAQQVIDLGISPAEFVAELKLRWQAKERA